MYLTNAWIPLEGGYGISLRPLYSYLLTQTYKNCETTHEAMHRAIAIILFKVEAQVIRRHPEYGMEERLFCIKIDYENKCITISGNTLRTYYCRFPQPLTRNIRKDLTGGRATCSGRIGQRICRK